MQQIITSNTKQFNNYFSQSTIVNRSTTRNVNKLNSNDLLAKLLNSQIISNIESYIRTITKSELELIKYLNYYFKKWDGCIAIPVTNIMQRFGWSQSWVEKLIARLYDMGMLITTGGGFGRKVTKRTFTERAKIVIKAVVKGFGAIKQDIPKKSTDYCTDYSGRHTNYISSKVDIVQENVVSQPTEGSKERIMDMLKACREGLGLKKNE